MVIVGGAAYYILSGSDKNEESSNVSNEELANDLGVKSTNTQEHKHRRNNKNNKYEIVDTPSKPVIETKKESTSTSNNANNSRNESRSKEQNNNKDSGKETKKQSNVSNTSQNNNKVESKPQTKNTIVSNQSQSNNNNKSKNENKSSKKSKGTESQQDKELKKKMEMEDDGFTVVSTLKEKSNAKEIEVKAKKELKEYLKSTY